MRRLVNKTEGVSRRPEQNRQQDLGNSMMRDMIPQGIMENPVAGTMMEGFNTLKEGYQRVEPYLPDINPRDKTIEYDYTMPVGPGQLNVGGEYDFKNDGYNLFGNYSFSFDDGGIATLAGDLEQRMTPPDPQQMDPKKLTDEQKDYLYDYMLDFMFKQKQREQMENECRIPPFNYFDMEV